MATLNSWKSDSGLDSVTVLKSKELPPLYHQIKEIITRQVTSGRWKSDHALPSGTDLFNQFEVSFGTVRRHGLAGARRIPPRLHPWRPRSLSHHTVLIAQTCSQPSLPEPR